MGDIDHDPNENSSVMGIVMGILTMMVMGILATIGHDGDGDIDYHEYISVIFLPCESPLFYGKLMGIGWDHGGMMGKCDANGNPMGY